MKILHTKPICLGLVFFIKHDWESILGCHLGLMFSLWNCFNHLFYFFCGYRTLQTFYFLISFLVTTLGITMCILSLFTICLTSIILFTFNARSLLLCLPSFLLFLLYIYLYMKCKILNVS